MSVERPFSTSESQQQLHAGPLARAIDGFAAWLAIEGYACRSAAAELRFVGSLSRWLEHEDLQLKEKAWPRPPPRTFRRIDTARTTRAWPFLNSL